VEERAGRADNEIELGFKRQLAHVTLAQLHWNSPCPLTGDSQHGW
jgi:hypothetical protein